MRPSLFALSTATAAATGLLLTAGAANSASAGTQQSPAAAQRPAFEQSLVWTTIRTVTNRSLTAAAQSAASASPYDTAATPSGQAVPLDEYRVGPLFGRVGGPHTGGVHSGLDLGADAGEPISAIEGGTVIVAGWQGAAGKAVTIKTADGKSVLYGHMSSMAVETGDRVKTGERIGRVGSTGNSTGPHLHIGVTTPKGTLLDPLVWMDLGPRQLARLSS